MIKELNQILELQEIDKVIDQLTFELNACPVQVQDKKDLIIAVKKDLEEKKGALTTFQLSKKNKELELGSCEERIRKHEGELNSLKSNESYKAMLREIDTVKEQKSVIETEILTLFEQIDAAHASAKSFDATAKQQEQAYLAEIAQIEARAESLKSQLAAETQKREAFLPSLEAEALSVYEYIRKKKGGVAIVHVHGDSCGGCNTTLTPGILNEVKKQKSLVRCESCSRILCVAEKAATAPVNAG